MGIKTIVLALVLLLAPMLEGADYRFYSRSGSYSGRASTTGSSTRFFSSSGRYVGRASTGRSSTRIYSSSGKYGGSVRSSSTGAKK